MKKITMKNLTSALKNAVMALEANPEELSFDDVEEALWSCKYILDTHLTNNKYEENNNK